MLIENKYAVPKLLGRCELAKRRYKTPYAVSECAAKGEVMNTWRGVVNHGVGTNGSEKTSENLGGDCCRGS